MSRDVVVGIDLGTTNSAIALFRDGEPLVIENALGAQLTPSAVARDPRGGELVVGRTAKDIIALHPSAGAAFFKRSMGQNSNHSLGADSLSPVELSACVLSSLRADAERVLGDEVTQCVISVPAYFDESQRVATRRAGELAGLKVLRIINEPTAAAIAYGIHQLYAEQLFMVFDLGGGTLDVCVMELFEGSLEVRSTAGISNLGGEDFTSALRARVLRELKLFGERVEMVDPQAYSVLYTRCELAKRELTEADGVAVVVPALEGMLKEATEVSLTREQIEDGWSSLLGQLASPVRSALRGASITPHQIEKVLLVGGATRMPCVRKVVQDLLRKELLSHIDPDLAIVRGAAIQGALCVDDEAVSDIVVTDVASHTLGVDSTREMAGTHVGGFFAPIIHRNTVLPTSRSQTFGTVDPNQRSMEFSVFEGEARKVSENRLIGKLLVKGIPKGPPGQLVSITFTFDLDGILEVEATIDETGAKFSAVFERSGRELSKKELAAAQERIAAIRANPAERPEVSDLLARADLLCRDLVGKERSALEQFIDQLEEAILTRTPQLISEAEKALKEIVDQLGGDERW